MKQKKTNQKLENETNIDKYNYKSLTNMSKLKKNTKTTKKCL